MNAKHTPGPWIVSNVNTTPPHISTLATVAYVGDYQIGIETGRPGGDYRSGLLGDEEADAALIAAAPDLLEALRDLLAVKPNSDAPEWVAARAAIAKAGGES